LTITRKLIDPEFSSQVSEVACPFLSQDVPNLMPFNQSDLYSVDQPGNKKFWQQQQHNEDKLELDWGFHLLMKLKYLTKFDRCNY